MVKGTVLLIIDFQDYYSKTLPKNEFDKVKKNTLKAIKICKLLDIPIVNTEVFPEKLGSTDQDIEEACKSGSGVFLSIPRNTIDFNFEIPYFLDESITENFIDKKYMEKRKKINNMLYEESKRSAEITGETVKLKIEPPKYVPEFNITTELMHYLQNTGLPCFANYTKVKFMSFAIVGFKLEGAISQTVCEGRNREGHAVSDDHQKEHFLQQSIEPGKKRIIRKRNPRKIILHDACGSSDDFVRSLTLKDIDCFYDSPLEVLNGHSRESTTPDRGYKCTTLEGWVYDLLQQKRNKNKKGEAYVKTTEDEVPWQQKFEACFDILHDFN